MRDKAMTGEKVHKSRTQVLDPLAEVSEAALSATEAEARRHIASSPISERRKTEFRKDYLKSREQIGATEKLFKHLKAFQQASDANASAAFGFDVILQKGPFVEQSNWLDMGAWDFAVAEERHLLSKLRVTLAEATQYTGHLLEGEVSRTGPAILDCIDTLAQRMTATGFAPSAAVIATDLGSTFIPELDERMTVPGWKLPDELRTNWILGAYHEMPVLYIRQAQYNEVYVLDVARFGSLVQYGPRVEFEVAEIPEVEAKRLKRQRLELALSLDDFRIRARLRLYQSYEFEVRERGAVYGARLGPATQKLAQS